MEPARVYDLTKVAVMAVGANGSAVSGGPVAKPIKFSLPLLLAATRNQCSLSPAPFKRRRTY